MGVRASVAIDKAGQVRNFPQECGFFRIDACLRGWLSMHPLPDGL